MSQHEQLIDWVKQSQPNFAPQRPKEDDKRYFLRIMGVLAEASEEIFGNDTTDPTKAPLRAWYNGNARSLDAGGVLTPPEGFVSAFINGRGEKKAPTPRVRTAPATPVAEGTRRPTIGRIVREQVIKKKDTTLEDVMPLLEQAGHKDVKTSTVLSFIRGSVDTLQVAVDLGRFAWPSE